MIDHNTASDDELIAFCKTPGHALSHELPYIVQLSDTAIVKFGVGVYEEEANNQRRAFDLLNPHTVRVPRVYRFFQLEIEYGMTEGYLVMEYIDGDIPSPERYPTLAARLLPILEQFETIQHSIPGPLGGGISYGMFWEDDYPCFTSTKTLEDWINQRIFGKVQKLSFENTTLVLCHMDLAPRNIMELSDGSICILDWASAGFYPHVFEVAMLQIKPFGENEDKFIEPLLQHVMSKQEPTQLAQVTEAWGNSQRFHM
ncbi:hypothetical protein E2P81_ATG09396 [Venturia nashicola]|uniref:Aminoglycoside phosphotransferase domain-containing protein n=1 Tax=Venturia nashicola TaxID=86259 RepID=A0A4Z1NZU2_9PEZI|nr:hypothetical protein E6O75_ATG09603 [Venturia nashicola]TLD25739.1 hypothetical protein E2P81_ATG09396 [Venturia nashicola]